MCRIEHDANLLANRIALLKQEEMKTWKKIEDTRKRTNEITSLKNRNEDRIRQVSPYPYAVLTPPLCRKSASSRRSKRWSATSPHRTT